MVRKGRRVGWHQSADHFAVPGQPNGFAASGAIDEFVEHLDDVEELRIPPNFGAHILTGDRAGTWSLTVTKNWQMTFCLNAAGAVEDLDLEDYH